MSYHYVLTSNHGQELIMESTADKLTVEREMEQDGTIEDCDGVVWRVELIRESY